MGYAAATPVSRCTAAVSDTFSYGSRGTLMNQNLTAFQVSADKMLALLAKAAMCELGDSIGDDVRRASVAPLFGLACPGP